MNIIDIETSDIVNAGGREIRIATVGERTVAKKTSVVNTRMDTAKGVALYHLQVQDPHLLIGGRDRLIGGDRLPHTITGGGLHHIVVVHDHPRDAEPEDKIYDTAKAGTSLEIEDLPLLLTKIERRN